MKRCIEGRGDVGNTIHGKDQLERETEAQTTHPGVMGSVERIG